MWNYTYNGILFSHEKKNEVLIHGMAWMNLENIMLSEISQTQKERCSRISFIRNNSNRQKVDWRIPGAGGRGERGVIV